MSAHRLALMLQVVVMVFVSTLAWVGASAFAAAPEAPGPVTVAVPVGATKVSVEGVLSPGGEGHPGTYEFLFNKASSGECRDGSHAPASPAMALGFEHEEVIEGLAGLEPHTEYMVCLAERNQKGEETVGPSATFTTALALEAPVAVAPVSATVTATSATLRGMLNPDGPGEAGSYEFLYRASGSECQGWGASGGAALGGKGEAVSAEVGGLSPNTLYAACLLARNEAGETVLSAPVTFTTLSGKPGVSGESFSNVGSTGATVSAQVETGGLETTYTVQYGTTNAFGSEISAEKLAAGTSSVTAQLSGLQPNTEYHFRVVLANTEGSEAGLGSTTFRTLPTGIQGLPDGRVYEMVTPVEKEDAEVYIPDAALIGEQEDEGLSTPGLSEPAADGDAVVYQGDPTHDGRGESSGNALGSAYLARRSADDGWSQMSIQPAGRRYTEYKGFSSDLSIGVIEAPTENLELEEPQLPGGKAPTGTHEEGHIEYYDLYRHFLTEDSYQPLFTAIPNRTPRELSGVYHDNDGSGHENKEHIPAPVYAGASTSMSQLLFGVNDDALVGGSGPLETELAEDVKQEITNEQSNDYLYDWSAGRPYLVDVLPDGKVAPDSVFGAPTFAAFTRAAGNPPDFSHVISADGSRVFWSELEGEISHGSSGLEGVQIPKALYVRENATAPQSPLNAQNECMAPADACTIQIDKEVGGGGRFWTASSDGSKAFFTAPNDGNDLYEYEVNPTVGQSGVLRDLTPGVEVQGVIGASEDGTYVYYVNGSNELYMLHEDDGGWEAPTQITTLSSEDGDEVRPISRATVNFATYGGGHAGDWVPDIGLRTAEVSSDGQGLVFMSNQSLPVQGFPHGYQNDGQQEVYVYNAQANSLSCASCDPSGEPPQLNFENERGEGAAAFIPVSWSDNYIPTLISEDGDRVFFESFMPLVSRDTNGKLDVYEWEREGAGSCARGQGAEDGCVYLLSGGTGSEPSWLLGSSANGSDVFIISRTDLTSDAGDELYKLFDTRVDGVEPLSPPACSGTGCQGVPGAPPTFATPSSVTFEGVGNFPTPTPGGSTVKAKAKKPLTRAQMLNKTLKTCKGKPKKVRAVCESRARRRYASKMHAKKSSSSKGRGSK
jgi:hypothetical protein